MSTVSYAPSLNARHRVILHFDMDAFYVACERELRPELRGKPLGVSQYNPYGDLRDLSIEDPSRLVIEPNNNNNRNGNGSLIAVSYEARAQNVKRNDRGQDALKKCPDLYVMQVPMKHGKADLTIYRSASQRIMKVVSESMIQAAKDILENIIEGAEGIFSEPKEFSQIKVEKASVDEVYVDVSQPVHDLLVQFDSVSLLVKETVFQCIIQGVAEQTTVGGVETNEAGLANNRLSKYELRRGSSLQVKDAPALDTASLAWWGRPFNHWSSIEIALAFGAALTARTRSSVTDKFENVFTMSGGVSINKTMAKLASGMKKPNRQTLIHPKDEATLQKLFYPLPLGRIRGLGGKFGEQVEEILEVSTVGEVARLSKPFLLEHFAPEQAEFLYNISRGLCTEEVEDRTKPKSIGAGKTFRNQLAIASDNHTMLQKWLYELASDIDERLEMDNLDHHRYASLLVVHLRVKALDGASMRSSSSMSKSTHLSYHNGTKEHHGEMALKLAKELLVPFPEHHVVAMTVTATNFIPIATGSQSIAVSLQTVALSRKRSLENEEKTSTSDNLSNSENHDYEYAKSLQASFDKENEMLTLLEQRSTSKRPKHIPKITAFFRPKR